MTVLIVAGSWMVRSGLKQLISASSDGPDILEASSLDEARSVVADSGDIELALMDPGLDDPNWLNNLALVFDRADTKIALILTRNLRREEFLQSLDAGVLGFVSEDASRQEMTKAIERVRDNELYIQFKELIALESTEDVRGSDFAASQPGMSLDIVLTRREGEVLQLLAEGKTNSEIAVDLGITQNTVRTYTSFLMKKFNLKDRTQVALHASDIVARTKTANND